ncbi:MAG: hypothetical protein ACK5K7_07500 [Bacilli bacterium]
MKINFKFLEGITTPDQFEKKMNETSDGFFSSLTEVLKNIFSSVSGIVSLLAGLACITFIIMALASSERRKGFLITAGLTLVIALLAITVYFVFGK